MLKPSLFILSIYICAIANAQEVETQKVYNTFNSTRVINNQSIDMLDKKTLDVRILHRFGLLGEGYRELFGLDNATIRLGFDYGITNDLNVGIGRSVFRKEVDAFAKYRIVQQSTGARQMPISLVLHAGYATITEKSFVTPKPTFWNRSSYYFQLLAGRKFNNTLSLQLTGLMLHINAPGPGIEASTIWAPGIATKVRLNKRLSLTGEYAYRFGQKDPAGKNPVGLGLDIETRGHIFQLHLSNARGMNERAVMNQTYFNFFTGQVMFGFNLSRLFHL